MNSKVIRVMIVDDHELIREGISTILNMERNIEVVNKARSGSEAIKILKKGGVDVVLLDINMPDMNGIETLKKIKEDGLKAKVLMLTVYDDIEYVSQSINLGADGYVLKDSDADTLVKTITIVNEGGSYISSWNKTIVLPPISSKPPDPSSKTMQGEKIRKFGPILHKEIRLSCMKPEMKKMRVTI